MDIMSAFILSIISFLLFLIAHDLIRKHTVDDHHVFLESIVLFIMIMGCMLVSSLMHIPRKQYYENECHIRYKGSQYIVLEKRPMCKLGEAYYKL